MYLVDNVFVLIQGDVLGKDADASLTAFVLIAMQEGSEICARSFPVSLAHSPVMSQPLYTRASLTLCFNNRI